MVDFQTRPHRDGKIRTLGRRRDSTDSRAYVRTCVYTKRERTYSDMAFYVLQIQHEICRLLYMAVLDPRRLGSRLDLRDMA